MGTGEIVGYRDEAIKSQGTGVTRWPWRLGL